MLAVDFEIPTWAPLGATLGPGDHSSRHAHHALHFVLAREGELAVHTDTTKRAAGVLTRADVPHHIDAAGLEVLLVFLDPESGQGRRLSACLPPNGVRLLSDTERTLLLTDVTLATFQGPEAPLWIERALSILDDCDARLAPPPPFDARVRRALLHLRAHPEITHSLESLAGAVGLSPSHFLHLFTESVGIPVRPYLAWLRFQRALALLGSEASLARVAAQAGFSDAAHMSRAFRSMFGVTPSELRKRGVPLKPT